MPFENARRRSAALACQSAAHDREQRVGESFVKRCKGVWRFAQGALLIGTAVFGSGAIVKIVDALLDRLR